MSPRRALLALPLATAVVACSSSFAYDYAVTIADDVIFDPDATVVMVASEDHDDIAAGVTDAEVRVGNTEKRFSGGGATCCAPSATMYFFAFLDTDQDGRWDEGEPWGADPENPVEISEDGYVAEIVIERDE